MQTKYTKDGKKVAIVGQLNKTEWIVQEIMVAENGDEIPCGENFTAKSLLDQPMKSYKETILENLEKEIEGAEKSIKALKANISKLEASRRGHREMLEEIISFTDALDKKEAGELAALLSLDYDYACRYRTTHWEDENGEKIKLPYKLESCHFDNQSIVDSLFIRTSTIWSSTRSFDSVRSMSIYGRTHERDINFSINEFSDLSGGQWHTQDSVAFFNDEEDFNGFLRDLLKNQVITGIFCVDTARTIKEAGIELPQDYIDALVEHNKNAHKKMVSQAEVDMENRIKSSQTNLDKTLELINKVQENRK